MSLYYLQWPHLEAIVAYMNMHVYPYAYNKFVMFTEFLPLSLNETHCYFSPYVCGIILWIRKQFSWSFYLEFPLSLSSYKPL